MIGLAVYLHHQKNVGSYMAEPMLLNEEAVQVTRRRLVVHNQTYELRDITSVEIGTAGMSRAVVSICLVLGAGALLGAQVVGEMWCLALGVILLAIGALGWWRSSRTFTLIVGTAGGAKQVLASRNRKFIDLVAQAIDAVLVERQGRRV